MGPVGGVPCSCVTSLLLPLQCAPRRRV